MKKTILLLFIIVSVVSCKKDSTTTVVPFKCATCVATSQALAANDAISKGIYKGTVSGSSGTIIFDVMNAGTTITAKMVLDGVTVNLTASVTWVGSQSYVAPFTGTLNGSPVSITFSVGASGSSPTVTTSSIPGHPGASFVIMKETSTSLIEIFEGTYHTTLPEDGTFNLFMARTARVWGADARKSGSTVSTGSASGVVTTDNKLMDGTNMLGTLSGDEISGSFQDSNGKTVTITAKRSL